MKKIIGILFIGLIFNVNAQNRTIGFYNLENLFDTIDGSHNDDEFLPVAKTAWNSAKYQLKLKRLNEVIDIMGSPILLGFCEIENKQVVDELMAYSPARKHYGVVHHESPDERGIDVALAYDPSVLTFVTSGILRFSLDNPENPKTRDILWAKFVAGKDTIVAMVNHWPSRRSGQDESEPNRLKAAGEAKKFIDEIMVNSPKTKIVFMGDLNDHPTDKAPQLIATVLNPMITKVSGKFGGSYNYQGTWDVLDHIMVSKNFFKGKKVKVKKKSGKIYTNDFLITEYKGILVPKRNYGGANHLDGYSDHLPVSISVKVK